MAITWGDIQNWKHGNLNTAMQDLATLRKGLAEGKSAASKAQGQIQSTGAAANGAKASLGKLVDELGERVDDATELGLATSEAADGVWDVETKVHECTSFVAQYPYLSIDGDGGVHWDMDFVPSSPGQFLNTISPVNFSELGKSTSISEGLINSLNPTAITNPGMAVGKALFDASPAGLVTDNLERKQKAEQLKKLIDAAVNRAAEVDEAYAKRLVGVRDGTYDHSKLKGKAPRLNLPGLGSMPIPGQEDKPWPPEGVDSPTEVSNWWNSLTEEEQREFMEKNPGAIRNLDGMPGSVRDELNRKALPDELEQAEQDMKNAPADSEEAKQAKRRYDDLKKIQDIMNQKDPTGKPYQLLGLDASGDGDVRAIVASGDVDTAQNVGTVVPGISTTARDSMDGLVGEANKYIADTEPFKLKGEEGGPAWQRLATILHTLAQAVADLNLMLSPFLPHAANDVDRAMGGRGAIAPMPELREARELDPRVLPEAFAGRSSYPIITGDYTTAPAWGRHEVVIGTPVAKPRPVFIKLDEAIVDQELARYADRLPDDVTGA